MLKTTRLALEHHREPIEDGFLSRTFRDALAITRRLGFRYIWIDALCIVQDDPHDWAMEAARMGDIDSEASLSIAATSSADGTRGYFHERNTGHEESLQSSQELGCELFLRLPPEHTFVKSLASPYNTRTAPPPLATWRWCFQERVLSRRVLDYTEFELVWECETDTQCECDAVSERD